MEEGNKYGPLCDADESDFDDPFLAESLADWPYTPDIYTELTDKYFTTMKSLIISVIADNGSCEAHLIERTHRRGMKYWHLDQTASIWDGILVPQGYLDQDSLENLEGGVRTNAKFPLPMARDFPLPHRNARGVEEFHYVTMTVKATGGSR